MTYHVCVVRTDVPLGVLAAQLIHAAGESTVDLPPGAHAVALGAPTEHALRRVQARLVEEGVPHVVIAEPDAPWNGAVMAIGVRPAVDGPWRQGILRRLQLVRDHQPKTKGPPPCTTAPSYEAVSPKRS